MEGEPDGEKIYVYVKLIFSDAEKALKMEETTERVINIEAVKLWGWHCEPCGVDSGPEFYRGAAIGMLESHCGTSAHGHIVRITE